MTQAIVRIGTRKSELAQWQANKVGELLKEIGIQSKLVLIDSVGDQNLIQPIYKIGVSGVFTKTLDVALLNDQIDIAVHSMKDVPVQLPQGIIQLAVLERASTADILVPNTNNTDSKTIATSSLRRRAQWLSKFQDHSIAGIRGNVNTRMAKTAKSNWKGAIFAKAGLERVNLLPEHYEELNWMIPAPAQGAIMVVGQTKNDKLAQLVQTINHSETDVCTKIERDILAILEGGCTAPIAAIAEITGEKIKVKCGLYDLDGSSKSELELDFLLSEKSAIASKCANALLANGGAALLAKIKSQL
jgi:hydroxymethylbilane synthase